MLLLITALSLSKSQFVSSQPWEASPNYTFTPQMLNITHHSSGYGMETKGSISCTLQPIRIMGDPKCAFFPPPLFHLSEQTQCWDNWPPREFPLPETFLFLVWPELKPQTRLTRSRTENMLKRRLTSRSTSPSNWSNWRKSWSNKRRPSTTSRRRSRTWRTKRGVHHIYSGMKFSRYWASAGIVATVGQLRPVSEGVKELDNFCFRAARHHQGDQPRWYFSNGCDQCWLGKLTLDETAWVLHWWVTLQIRTISIPALKPRLVLYPVLGFFQHYNMKWAEFPISHLGTNLHLKVPLRMRQSKQKKYRKEARTLSNRFEVSANCPYKFNLYNSQIHSFARASFF